MANAKPSVDPANEDTLGGAFNTILRKFQQSIQDMLPAMVVSYDRPSNRATVLPMVMMLTTIGEQVQRAQVASMPALLLGAGGQMLSFNIKPGDLGWIKANDRDISLFLQNFANGPPNTWRMHSFEDALFIPDAMRGFTVPAGAEDCANLQSLDGTVRLSVGADHIDMEAAGSKFTLNAAGFNYTGGPFVINGIAFDTHVHSGVTPGPSNTGGPL